MFNASTGQDPASTGQDLASTGQDRASTGQELPDRRGPGHYLWWLVTRQRARCAAGAAWGSAWMVGLTLPPYALARAVDDGLTPGDGGPARAVVRGAVRCRGAQRVPRDHSAPHHDPGPARRRLPHGPPRRRPHHPARGRAAPQGGCGRGGHHRVRRRRRDGERADHHRSRGRRGGRLPGRRRIPVLRLLAARRSRPGRRTADRARARAAAGPPPGGTGPVPGATGCSRGPVRGHRRGTAGAGRARRQGGVRRPLPPRLARAEGTGLPGRRRHQLDRRPRGGTADAVPRRGHLARRQDGRRRHPDGGRVGRCVRVCGGAGGPGVVLRRGRLRPRPRTGLRPAAAPFPGPGARPFGGRGRAGGALGPARPGVGRVDTARGADRAGLRPAGGHRRRGRTPRPVHRVRRHLGRHPARRPRAGTGSRPHPGRRQGGRPLRRNPARRGRRTPRPHGGRPRTGLPGSRRRRRRTRPARRPRHPCRRPGPQPLRRPAPARPPGTGTAGRPRGAARGRADLGARRPHRGGRRRRTAGRTPGTYHRRHHHLTRRPGPGGHRAPPRRRTGGRDRNPPGPPARQPRLPATGLTRRGHPCGPHRSGGDTVASANCPRHRRAPPAPPTATASK
ncbi:hypothetical protein SSPIM334S_07440 [Streptomyces spiroverticillatus]